MAFMQIAVDAMQSVLSSMLPNSVQTASTDVKTIRDNFRSIEHDGLFYVAEFKRPGGEGSFYGRQLMMVPISNERWLMAFQLFSRNKTTINDATVQQKAFPFVYDTKSMTNNQERANSLANSLRPIFPEHYVNIFIYNGNWNDSFNGKGSANFSREYGSNVHIILT